MDAAFRENTMFERSRFRVNAHLLAHLVLALELDHAVDLGKERIIASLAHVHSGMDLGPALTNDDRAGEDLLACISLHTQVLPIAGPSITGTANTFFMSH